MALLTLSMEGMMFEINFQFFATEVALLINKQQKK